MATDAKDMWRTTGIALVTSLFTVIATGMVQGFREDLTWRRDHKRQEMQAQVAKAREAIDLTESIVRQGAALEAGMKRDFEIMEDMQRALRTMKKTRKWKPFKEQPKHAVAEMLIRLDTDGPKLRMILHEVWVTDRDEGPFEAYSAWVASLDALTGAYWAVLDSAGYEANVKPPVRLTAEEAKQKHKEAAAAEQAARDHLMSEVKGVWGRMLERLHRFPDPVRFVKSERERWAILLAGGLAGWLAGMILNRGIRYAWARYRAATSERALPKAEDAGRGREFHDEPSGD